jgi:preprotein translocase subunit YajC
MQAAFQVFAASSGSGSGTAGGAAFSWIFILLIGAVFYFLLIRPQQRQRRAQQELVRSIEVGDEVITSSGLFGRVVELDDNDVVLEVAPQTRLRFIRGAISRRLTEDEGEDEEQEEDQDADESS